MHRKFTRHVCAENVPVPDQLRNPAGIKQLKTALRDKFAKSRALQLHCIKLACRWPDHSSPYADLLGWLTTLGDVEALGYQWQGQKDKSHNADRLLKQVRRRNSGTLFNGNLHNFRACSISDSLWEKARVQSLGLH